MLPGRFTVVELEARLEAAVNAAAAHAGAAHAALIARLEPLLSESLDSAVEASAQDPAAFIADWVSRSAGEDAGLQEFVRALRAGPKDSGSADPSPSGCDRPSLPDVQEHAASGHARSLPLPAAPATAPTPATAPAPAPTPAPAPAPAPLPPPAASGTGAANNEAEALSEEETRWRYLRGHELEPALASGAIALLDAGWLVASKERGETIQRRQELPPEAFISLAELKAACKYYLPIICLSYAWLHPDHPDPKGAQLTVVARALEAFISRFPRLGLFWDYGSLMQHGSLSKRTEAEEKLFKQGLGFLGSFYSHQETFVFRLTTFPEGYPDGYDLPSDANVAAYPDRGWCFTEMGWATMTKGSAKSLDLGKLRGDERTTGDVVKSCARGGARPPPLLPEQFAEKLEEKRFTNGKDDKPLVAGLYKQAFEEEFGKAEVLGYSLLGWGDAEAVQISKLLASGAAPKLKALRLDRNQIGDEGVKALAEAIAGGAAPALHALDLSFNKASQAAKDAIKAAAGERSIECDV